MAPKPKKCEQCGKSFKPKKYWARWCGAECRKAWYKDVYKRGVKAKEAQ